MKTQEATNTMPRDNQETARDLIYAEIRRRMVDNESISPAEVASDLLDQIKRSPTMRDEMLLVGISHTAVSINAQIRDEAGSYHVNNETGAILYEEVSHGNKPTPSISPIEAARRGIERDKMGYTFLNLYNTWKLPYLKTPIGDATADDLELVAQSYEPQRDALNGLITCYRNMATAVRKSKKGTVAKAISLDNLEQFHKEMVSRSQNLTVEI